MALESLEVGAGFLKAGFLGFQGGGKTYTAGELAAGTRNYLKLDGPVAMYDTETGSAYLAPRIRKLTGKQLVGRKGRTLSEAISFLIQCRDEGVSVAIVDSVSHLWNELCSSYLDQVHEAKLKQNPNAKKRTRLEFQDWGPIKKKWAEFTDLFLTIPLHVIICGRAGYSYDYQVINEETEKKELVKTGIKMKAEGEFGYEPSLLVEMVGVQTNPTSNDTRSITHVATVLKDRFDLIDGKTCENPAFEFFKPFIAALTPGAPAPALTGTQTPLGVDEEGQAEWNRERKMRAIAWEEIGLAFTVAIPGKGAIEQKAKAKALEQVFGTASPTAIENMQSVKLREGLKALREVAIPAAVEEIKAHEEVEKKEKKSQKEKVGAQ